jgi:hypothetical protein
VKQPRRLVGGRQHQHTAPRCQPSAETVETISSDRPLEHHPSQYKGKLYVQ